MADDDYLSKLLNLEFQSDYFKENENIGSAILHEIHQNPKSATRKYEFDNNDYGDSYTVYPLHQAISLRANIDIIQTLYNYFPPAIRDIHEGCGYSALHLAVDHRAPSDVVLFILEKLPEETWEKDIVGFLPLHYACQNGYPMEVIFPLYTIWPFAVREKTETATTPLHDACAIGRTDVINLLLTVWPGAVREKDFYNYTPLHYAIDNANLKVENVSLLLEKYSDALREKDVCGQTFLHFACSIDTPLKVMTMLLEPFPEAVIEKNSKGQTPLDIYESSNNSFDDVHKVLSSVYQICGNTKMENETAENIMNFFIEIEWWKGIELVLDYFPSFYKYLGINTEVFPQFVHVLGRRCRMKTMWHVISNEMDITGNV